LTENWKRGSRKKKKAKNGSAELKQKMEVKGKREGK